MSIILGAKMGYSRNLDLVFIIIEIINFDRQPVSVWDVKGLGGTFFQRPFKNTSLQYFVVIFCALSKAQ